MDEMNDPRMDDVVEAHLRYLRGEGPKPDLSSLSDAERDAVAQMLDLVEAMADSLPPSPPLDEDPVAVRLGLVDQASLDDAQDGDIDPVLVAVDELAFRFNETVEVELATTSSLDSNVWRPVVACRSLAELVLVVAVDADRPRPTAVDAHQLFQERPELTAVAFTYRDAAQAAVVTRSESAGRLIPDQGWRDAGTLRWEPLDIALGRHLDRSIPRWDQVASLPPGDLLEDLAEEAQRIVERELTRVAKTRPQLPHKRHAREFVSSVDAPRFVAWVDAVRARRASGEGLTSEISDLSRAGTP
jgi:hypothetical protein